MATSKPNLNRIWAGGAPANNVIDPDTTTPGKFDSGWLAEVPPFEHFNFLQKLFTEALAHNNEEGINLWDTNTTYSTSALAKGSDGNIYKSVSEQSGNDPVSDGGANWVAQSSINRNADFQALRDTANSAYSLGEMVYIDNFTYPWIKKSGAVAASIVDNGWYIIAADDLDIYYESSSPVVNAAIFGAVGDWDGSSGTDNTTALQNAIDTADNLAVRRVYVPAGDYLYTKVVIPMANNYGSARFELYGDGLGITVFRTDTDRAIDLDSNKESGTGYNVDLHDFTLRGNGAKPENGIYSDGLAFCHFYNLHVLSFENNIRCAGDTFVNRFTKLFLSGAPQYGFRMDASGTTNFWDCIFTFGATVNAYQLSGAYNTVGSLAADDCSGGAAYNFNFFSGTVNSLGNESSDVDRMITCSNSQFSIGYVLAFYNTVDDVNSKGGVIGGSGNNVKIENIKIEQSSSIVSTQAPFDMFDSIIKIGNTEYINIEYTGEPDGSASSSGAMFSTDKSTGIGISNDGTRRSYIGYDRGRFNFGEASPRIPGSLAVPKAIFLDMVGSPRFDSDGNDYRFGRPSKEGDIFLESDPGQEYQLGRITTSTGSDLNACSFLRIPLEIATTTANRPTTGLRAGLQIFDTTLGQPIWYNGSGWVDATGTSV